MTKALNLVGQRFGKLVVVSRAENNSEGRTMWHCRCDCGNMVIVSGRCLTRGSTKSCGCWRVERNIIHGYSNERLYHIWYHMVCRCTNPDDISYKNYGGDGIKVCDEWLNSFEAFRDWALANGYADDLTIERINSKGDYCPENCCWATMKRQQNNRRNNITLTIHGKTQTLAQHIEDPEINIYNLNGFTVRSRICNRGWPAEKAFSTPVRG